MFAVRRQAAWGSVCFLALLAVGKTDAATVMPSAYMAAGNIGDTWTYANLDSTQFTWTLSQVAAGPNIGRLRRGNNSTGIVYDVVNNAITWYEYDNQPITPYTFSEFYQTGQPAPDPLGDNPRISILFLTAPSITVPAGTYNDILMMVWLDGNFAANTVNTSLGLDPSITAGVTALDWYARGIGPVRYMDVAADTGGIGAGGVYELVSTTVPIPAAAWLFGSGLLGLIGVARKRSRAQ
jgi:hypothetical protein